MSKTTIHSFIPIEKLGEGSFSSVYKVRRVTDNQLYALKKIKMASLKEKEKANALNQVRILASLQSQNIVTYKQAFFDEQLKLLCIVMECANDGDLFNKINKNKESKTLFHESQIWRAMYHMLSGILVLHKSCILHRDLKSANIFISNGVYKIGDLNVSKISADKKLVKTQTGTPYYASPQVWRDQPYGEKSDIWSFGCILYEMCSWRPPFYGQSLEHLFKNVQKGKFPPIPQVYSQSLAQVIAKCLSLQPKDRPSAQQLLKPGGILFQKCEFYQIRTNVQKKTVTNQPLLSTIKMPFDIKGLNRNLPLSKYQKQSDINNSSFVTKPADSNQTEKCKSLTQNKKILPNPEINKKLNQPYEKQNSSPPLPQRIKNHLKSIGQRNIQSKLINKKPKFRLNSAIGPRQPHSILRYVQNVHAPFNSNQINARRPLSCDMKNRPLFKIEDRPSTGHQSRDKRALPLKREQIFQQRKMQQSPLFSANRHYQQMGKIKQRCHTAVQRQSINSSYVEIRRRLESRQKQISFSAHYSQDRKCPNSYLEPIKNEKNVVSSLSRLPIISKQVYLKKGQSKLFRDQKEDNSYLIQIQNKLLNSSNARAKKCGIFMNNQSAVNSSVQRLRSVSQKYRISTNIRH